MKVLKLYIGQQALWSYAASRGLLEIVAFRGLRLGVLQLCRDWRRYFGRNTLAVNLVRIASLATYRLGGPPTL